MPEFKLARKHWFREKIALAKTYRTYFRPGPLGELNRLLLFVGYTRSGHTLVGALLDAHPQVVIAHQAYALGYLQRGISKKRVFQLLLDNATRFTKSGREWMGYNYHIPGQWQGASRDLKIIGDKSGGITTRTFFHNNGLAEVDEVVRRTGLELSFIHVLRNPFDMISTMTKRAVYDQGHPDTEETFKLKVGHFFKHADGVALLKKHGRYRVFDIEHEKLVGDTVVTLAELCTALELPYTQQYLQACDGLVWDNPKKSRSTCPYWTEENVRLIAERLAEYPWFDGYTFES